MATIGNRVLSGWLEPVRTHEQALLKVICFPFVGSDATIYRGWANSLPDNIEIVAVQYPGRGRRANEEPLTDLETLCNNLLDHLDGYLDQRCVLFGHSMGGLVAYELARVLQKRKGMLPKHLFVSAAKPPHPALAPVHRATRLISHMDDESLSAELRRLDGTPRELLDNPAALRYFLPTIRADFRILESARFTESTPLACPITALCGTNDHVAPRHMTVLWRDLTTGPFEHKLIPGDHFYLLKNRQPLLTFLGAALTRIAGF